MQNAEDFTFNVFEDYETKQLYKSKCFNNLGSENNRNSTSCPVKESSPNIVYVKEEPPDSSQPIINLPTNSVFIKTEIKIEEHEVPKVDESRSEIREVHDTDCIITSGDVNNRSNHVYTAPESSTNRSKDTVWSKRQPSECSRGSPESDHRKITTQAPMTPNPGPPTLSKDDHTRRKINSKPNDSRPQVVESLSAQNGASNQSISTNHRQHIAPIVDTRHVSNSSDNSDNRSQGLISRVSHTSTRTSAAQNCGNKNRSGRYSESRSHFLNSSVAQNSRNNTLRGSRSKKMNRRSSYQRTSKENRRYSENRVANSTSNRRGGRKYANMNKSYMSHKRVSKSSSDRPGAQNLQYNSFNQNRKSANMNRTHVNHKRFSDSSSEKVSASEKSEDSNLSRRTFDPPVSTVNRNGLQVFPGPSSVSEDTRSVDAHENGRYSKSTPANSDSYSSISDRLGAQNLQYNSFNQNRNYVKHKRFSESSSETISASEKLEDSNLSRRTCDPPVSTVNRSSLQVIPGTRSVSAHENGRYSKSRVANSDSYSSTSDHLVAQNLQYYLFNQNRNYVKHKRFSESSSETISAAEKSEDSNLSRRTCDPPVSTVNRNDIQVIPGPGTRSVSAHENRRYSKNRVANSDSYSSTSDRLGAQNLQYNSFNLNRNYVKHKRFSDSETISASEKSEDSNLSRRTYDPPVSTVNRSGLQVIPGPGTRSVSAHENGRYSKSRVANSDSYSSTSNRLGAQNLQYNSFNQNRNYVKHKRFSESSSETISAAEKSEDSNLSRRTCDPPVSTVNRNDIQVIPAPVTRSVSAHENGRYSKSRVANSDSYASTSDRLGAQNLQYNSFNQNRNYVKHKRFSESSSETISASEKSEDSNLSRRTCDPPVSTVNGNDIQVIPGLGTRSVSAHEKGRYSRSSAANSDSYSSTSDRLGAQNLQNRKYVNHKRFSDSSSEELPASETSEDSTLRRTRDLPVQVIPEQTEDRHETKSREKTIAHDISDAASSSLDCSENLNVSEVLKSLLFQNTDDEETKKLGNLLEKMLEDSDEEPERPQKVTSDTTEKGKVRKNSSPSTTSVRTPERGRKISSTSSDTPPTKPKKRKSVPKMTKGGCENIEGPFGVDIDNDFLRGMANPGKEATTLEELMGQVCRYGYELALQDKMNEKKKKKKSK